LVAQRQLELTHLRLKQSQNHNIRSKAHFNHVFKNSKKIRHQLYYLYVATCYGSYPARAVVTSRKVGNAVKRNRCRRHVKSFFRTFQHQITTEYDMIVVVHSGMVGRTSQEIWTTLRRQLEKEGLWHA
jgi:ribonuclease P protein component